MVISEFKTRAEAATEDIDKRKMREQGIEKSRDIRTESRRWSNRNSVSLST
jgi:hypothetical protein